MATAFHRRAYIRRDGVDDRDKPGHDGGEAVSRAE
jgi:hypothetical protein